MSADEDDASAKNASATRVTGGQQRHQRDVVDGAIPMRATTPAVLPGREGGGGRGGKGGGGGVSKDLNQIRIRVGKF